MSKTVFVSFADTKMSAPLHRIKREAQRSEFFDEIYAFDENVLDATFRSKYSFFIENNKRGYGYWIWKPYLIRRVLEELNYGDILIYLDAGCEVNKNGKKRLEQYKEIAKANPLGILGFDTHLTECMYTKGDVLDFFDIRNKKEILQSGQVMGGLLIICKIDVSVQFVTEWESIILNNLSLIDDTPSKSPNYSMFIENRHDQSVLSILLKLNGGGIISGYEVDVCRKRPKNRHWRKLKNSPFLATRNRTGKIRWGNGNDIFAKFYNAYLDSLNWAIDILKKGVRNLRVKMNLILLG